MSDSNQPAPPTDPKQDGDRERTKQLEVAGWTAGVTAVVALGTLTTAPTWPTAIGVTAVAAMVSVVCYFIVRR